MTPNSRFGLLASLLPILMGCGSHRNQADSGASVPVLRKNIGMDLSQVGSFAVVSGASAASTSSALRSRLSAVDDTSGSSDGGSNQPRLLALTLSGETLDVSFVEEGNPSATGVIAQPVVSAIHTTPGWLFFSTFGFTAYKVHDDGSRDSIDCVTIAARRSDGALYCSSLGIHSDGSSVDGAVQSNAAGDTVYVASTDSSNNNIIYKLALSATDAPSATLVSAVTHANWFLSNATGDLLVNDFPSALDRSTNRTRVLPLAGGDAFTAAGAHNAFAISGKATDADRDTFYVMSGGGGGFPFDGTIRVLAPTGSSFHETPETTTNVNASWLLRLADGIYTVSISEKALFRVIVDGTVLADAVEVPLTGVSSIVSINGVGAFGAAGQVVVLCNTGSGFKFLRHDGVQQQDIPLSANLDLQKVTIGSTGAIDFFAIETDTSAKVRGAIAAGSTEVTLAPAGILDPANMVLFTRIN